MKIAIVVPHIFMQQAILPHVIFSPGELALRLAEALQAAGAEVTLLTPGSIHTSVRNITADLHLFEHELTLRGDNYLDLLKKHPLTFITLARQVQSELIARAYQLANENLFDVVHIYTNEEDTALPFAQFCSKPVIFTHHDPFNFLVSYKNVFPRYKHLNWLSISDSQRQGMPENTNWLATIYHGIDTDLYQPLSNPSNDYVAYLGRIIEPKGIHLAIAAVKAFNQQNPAQKLKLKIAGKHYSDSKKNAYWQKQIEPLIDGTEIDYVGYLKEPSQKQSFLSNAAGLIIPSIFEEPFGMVMIESLACGTPLIGLNSGAIPEVIREGETGFIAQKFTEIQNSKDIIDEAKTVGSLVSAIKKLRTIDRKNCRQDFEARFTVDQMVTNHLKVYQQLSQT